MTIHAVTITELSHHNDRVMFFSVTKPEGFTYRSGQFVRCGIALKENPQAEDDFLMRPYSLASHPGENKLSFYVARVLDGALSPKLFELKVGDTVYVDDTAYGLMLPERLEKGGTLFCFASGTGLSAFLSIVKNNPWERFDNVTIMLTKLLSKMEAKSIAYAGFDGFNPNDSTDYSEDGLRSDMNKNEKLMFNDEIASMLTDFILRETRHINMTFVTTSIFADAIKGKIGLNYTINC